MAALAGAAVATVAIFLPSFVFVAVTNPIVPRLRRSRWTAAFLDAVNAASLGLMAAVTIKLAGQIFFPGGWWPNATALLIAAAATAVALRWKVKHDLAGLGRCRSGMARLVAGLAGDVNWGGP